MRNNGIKEAYMTKKVYCSGNPIIKVDLTTGRITEEVLEEELVKKFIGGRGINDWLLYSLVDPGTTDPLGPENAMIFSSGLLVGCLGPMFVPGAIRLTVNFLNPFSGGYGESSSAGMFATELKRAGYDHIILRGRSENPVYLWITDEDVQIQEAHHLIGKTTFETDRMIREELGDQRIKVCSIGPAGEHIVRYASLNVTNRYCGRCGVGAVMGSKNLKAIAVRGKGSVQPFDPTSMAEIAHRVLTVLSKDEGVKWLAEHGMAGTPEFYDRIGTQSLKNYQEVGFDKISEIGYEAVRKYYKKNLPCLNCPVNCDRLVEIPEGEPYGGTRVSSMQTTPAFNFAKFLIDDIRTVIKGFELCNGLGLDIHSFTTVAQWAIECYERGILTKEDTDKLDLRWGDGPLILELIRRTAYREGKLGNLLAEGVHFASQKIGRGSEKYAIQMKKMEIDDELRTCKGWCLGIITDPRGPTHTFGAFSGEMKGLSKEQSKEMFGNEKAGDPLDYEVKPEIVVQLERARIIQDCLGLCYFATHKIHPSIIREYNTGTYAQLINAATGWDISEHGLIQIAERILAVEKVINVLAGLRRKDDLPPDRYFEPIPRGPHKGIALDREKLTDMIRKHDEFHGWDNETGIPHRRTLENLGLKELADTLSLGS
jgi:aldehyde:ferredoxin oxidoreductase